MALDSEHFSVLVHEKRWELTRENFAELEHYQYAHLWAKTIIWDQKSEDEGAEDASSSYIAKARCEISEEVKRGKVTKRLIFHCSQQGHPKCFQKGRRIILSRTDPETDGLYGYCMDIERMRGNRCYILEPPRIPADCKVGVWRLDVAKKDWYQQNRLLSNLKMMVSKEGCHSHLIQELVAADPDPTAVLRLNLREPF